MTTVILEYNEKSAYHISEIRWATMLKKNKD